MLGLRSDVWAGEDYSLINVWNRWKWDLWLQNWSILSSAEYGNAVYNDRCKELEPSENIQRLRNLPNSLRKF
jgi:hypothetical protein